VASRAVEDARQPAIAGLSAPTTLDALGVWTYCAGVVMSHRFVGLGLIVVVLALAPAAHAAPPDQSWIPGLYDDADFDDVVLLITSSLGAIQSNIVWSLRPVALVLSLALALPSESRPMRPLSSVLGRAPPLA